MNPVRLILPVTAFVVVLATSGSAQYDPPPVVMPEPETVAIIRQRTRQLEQALKQLTQDGVRDPELADIEIFHQAVVWEMSNKEFYHKDAGAWTLEALDTGLLRADQAKRAEKPWLNRTGTSVVRGYRSALDGSLQPYVVTYPANYGKGPPKKWRIDVVLHGRDASLTEVSFLHRHNGTRAASKEQDWVQLDLFGRGNNAYRWAGEVDVQEAINAFFAVEQYMQRPGLVDRSKSVLRGFSMGGAGTWHLGLHQPSNWSLLGPGAGFTTTRGYVSKLPDPLPPYVADCLHIYDAVDYAENAFDVPIVAYSGANDKQKQAADNIELALKKAGLEKHMIHLVAPGLEHQMPAEWQKKANEEYVKILNKEPPEPDYPPRVHFVTWTLKYSSCSWVDLLGLDAHYQRALIDARHTAEGFEVTTTNIRALSLRLPRDEVLREQVVTIDGLKIKARPVFQRPDLYIYLEKRDGQWTSVLPERLLTDRLRKPQKVSGLTGPIDDAFMAPFLCVRGTGEPWNSAVDAYSQANLERFGQEWSKYFRGTLPIKEDSLVTSEDLANRNLILFGDPSSNSLIAQALPGLPLKWTKEKLTWDGQEYAAGEHVPVLIFPSPFNPDRYVVINSGHTFHAADFQGTNALLYPRLGDFAILKLTGQGKDPLATEVVRAGLFDDFWGIVPRR
jgi:dienelactone hydrolase